jgi:2-polyprenyl-6-methoxyphenol hydroxylase-like FAD-dependent oxidoreductase
VSLFAGYGAALAILGAERLADALEREDLPTALRSWEAGLGPEVSRRQQLRRRNARIRAPTSRLALAMRHLSMRATALPPVRRMLRHRLQA